MMTRDSALWERYETERTAVLEQLRALEKIVVMEFPAPGAPPQVATRYDVDTMKDLKEQLAALVWGYERKSPGGAL